MLLSVVVPFYQVEAYIGECLVRLSRLPEQECEILLVDDCGTDGSARIAQEYCAAHKNMRLLRRACNGGLSAARNTGLEAAAGEYVWFVDSDDLPEPGPVMEMAEDALRKRLDVAKGRFAYYDDLTGKTTPGPIYPATEPLEGGALFAAQCRAQRYEPMVWQCLYRRGFLQKIGLRMAQGLLFEDELFQAPALLAAERAAAYEQVILLYRQRPGSIMTSFTRSSAWCESYLEVCRRLHALQGTLENGPARRALNRRVGQIALSTVKNVSGYGLPPDVAAEVMRFARMHRAELAGYALRSGDALVAAQGALMRLSLKGFLKVYSQR